MKLQYKFRWFLLLGILAACSAASAQEVILVANKGLQVTAISAADLRAIFLGTKTRFSDGSHAVPVTLKGGPVHEVFLRHYIGQSPGEFRAQWRKTVFTGQGAVLKAFDSESALLQYVAATPGALGYVSRFSPSDDVKPLPTSK